MLIELAELGFYDSNRSDKENLSEDFLRTSFSLIKYRLSPWNPSCWQPNRPAELFPVWQRIPICCPATLWPFSCLSSRPLLILQMLRPWRNGAFCITFETYWKTLPAAQHSTKMATFLVDKLVSEGLIPEDNTHHHFNGKSLATFQPWCHPWGGLRRITRGYSIKTVVRPSSRSALSALAAGKIPVVMTASPYHQGTNDPASDKALHDMNVDLQKRASSNKVQDPELKLLQLICQLRPKKLLEAELGPYRHLQWLLAAPRLCQSLCVWRGN